MATFPYSPDWGCKPTMTPRVNKCQFGDGYDQRSGDGLNTRLPVWPLTFSIRTQTEAQAIAAWLATNNADVTPFDWGGISGGVATSEWFGTGNGTQTTFQLLHGGSPVTSIVGTPTIYRTDWQGRVALSASPRTNKILNSANFSGWGLSNASFGTGAANPKDGGASTRLTRGASTTAESAVQTTSGGTIAGGSPLFEGVFAKAGTGKYLYLRILYADATLPSGLVQFDLSTGTVAYVGSTFTGKASIRPASNGWYFATINGIALASPAANRIDIGCADNLGLVTGSVGTYVDIYGGSLTDADGSYIATTTAPVTVTDYTLSGTGLVTLAVAPVSGATLTWSGNYTRKYIADEWTPATADDWGSWSVTAKFRQVPA